MTRKPTKSTAPSEIVSETLDAVRPAKALSTRTLVTGAALGIGSAALVAALLYANRAKKGDDEA